MVPLQIVVLAPPMAVDVVYVVTCKDTESSQHTLPPLSSSPPPPAHTIGSGLDLIGVEVMVIIAV